MVRPPLLRGRRARQAPAVKDHRLLGLLLLPVDFSAADGPPRGLRRHRRGLRAPQRRGQICSSMAATKSVVRKAHGYLQGRACLHDAELARKEAVHLCDGVVDEQRGDACQLPCPGRRRRVEVFVFVWQQTLWADGLEYYHVLQQRAPSGER